MSSVRLQFAVDDESAHFSGVFVVMLRCKQIQLVLVLLINSLYCQAHFIVYNKWWHVLSHAYTGAPVKVPQTNCEILICHRKMERYIFALTMSYRELQTINLVVVYIKEVPKTERFEFESSKLSK